MILRFKYDDTLVVHAETFAEANTEWTWLHNEKMPCLIWLKGYDQPWAAFPMARLALAEV